MVRIPLKYIQGFSLFPAANLMFSMDHSRNTIYIKRQFLTALWNSVADVLVLSDFNPLSRYLWSYAILWFTEKKIENISYQCLRYNMKVTQMEAFLPWKAHSDPLSINLCAQINSHSTSNRLILKSFLHRVRDSVSLESVYENKGSSQVVGNHSGLYHRWQSEIWLKSIWKNSTWAALLSSHSDLATYSSSSISMNRMLYNCLLLLFSLPSHKQWTWMHKIQETGCCLWRSSFWPHQDLYHYGSCSRVFSFSYNSHITSFMSFAKCQHLPAPIWGEPDPALVSSNPLLPVLNHICICYLTSQHMLFFTVSSSHWP
jgi:hypothetical protein